jgi:small subunit ribosomal protein S5
MDKEIWKPRTELGKAVLNGEITSIDEIFSKGLKIREPEIVDMLLPDLKTELIYIGGTPGKGGGIKRTPTRRTARMHRSGRRYKISAVVVVGRPGYIGVGRASAVEHADAINKATNAAKCALIPVMRGCGSWECGCGAPHSIPMIAKGKSGSVRVTLLPAPKGVGLCIGDEEKKMFRLVGIDDVWSRVSGETRTRLNYIQAIYDAFKSLNKMRLAEPSERSSASAKHEAERCERGEASGGAEPCEPSEAAEQDRARTKSEANRSDRSERGRPSGFERVRKKKKVEEDIEKAEIFELEDRTTER